MFKSFGSASNVPIWWILVSKRPIMVLFDDLDHFDFSTWGGCWHYKSLRNPCIFLYGISSKWTDLTISRDWGIFSKTFFFEEKLYLGEPESRIWAFVWKFGTCKSNFNTPLIVVILYCILTITQYKMVYIKNVPKSNLHVPNCLSDAQNRGSYSPWHNFTSKKKSFWEIASISRNFDFIENHCSKVPILP